LNRHEIMNSFVFLVLVFLSIISPLSSLTPQERIFDGITAPVSAFPWMVSVRIQVPNNILNIIPVCAGSIISDTYILTAASCFFNFHDSTSLFSVRAGIYDFFNPNITSEQIRQVSHIFVHPSYNASGYVNDIALIRLTRPLTLNPSSVWEISLSNVTQLEDLDLVVVGWGILNQSNPTIAANFLQQVVVQEDANCTTNLITNSTTQLCATGTCLRDSGGPLMIESNTTNNYEVVAVISHRVNCTTQGLFTRVAPFLDWIDLIMDTRWTVPIPMTTTPTTRRTTTTNTLGPPIHFVCNTSSTCGCSPVPVIFHDDPAYRSQGRIVGGEEAQPFSWSWQVSIQVPPLGHTCGGTMINDRWVLTAAHCLLIANLTNVRVSVHDKWSLAGQDRVVALVIRHPDFVPGPYYINDIALLRLSSPIILSQTNPLATKTCLPAQTNDREFPLPGTRLAVIGWGRLIENGPVPDRLQQVRVVTLRNDDWRCSAEAFDLQRQFCAMVDGGGRDSCQGDSGGPIHQWLNDHWEQVGIVSYGTGCAEPNNTGVYTRLAFYHDWIHDMIEQNEEKITTPIQSTNPTAATSRNIQLTDETTAFIWNDNRTDSTIRTNQAKSIYHYRSIFILRFIFTILTCITCRFFFY